MTTNVHIIDQLADVRAQIAALKEHEDKLRGEVSRLIGDDSFAEGDLFVAKQDITTRKGGLDEKALRAAGIEPDNFRKPESVVVTIRLSARASRAA
jgi:hypothetical protein